MKDIVTSMDQDLQGLCAAAAHAEAKFDWEAAAELYTRALDLVAGDLGTECDLYERRAKCCQMIGDYTAQLADLEKLASLAQSLEDLPRQVGALTGQVRALIGVGNPEKAIQTGEGVLELARQRGNLKLEANALNALSFAYKVTRKTTQVREIVERGQKIARQLGDPAVEADVLSWLAYLNARTGRMDLARKDGLAALELYRRLGDREGEADTLVTLAIAASDQAVPLMYMKQVLAIAETTGNQPLQARMGNNLGYNHFLAGLFCRAEAYLKKAVESNRSHGRKYLLAYPLLNLGRVYVAQGNPKSARIALEEALALARETGDRMVEGACRFVLGKALLAEGRALEAQASIQAGVEVHGESDLPSEPLFLAWQGAAHLAQGEVESAVAATQRAVEKLPVGSSSQSEIMRWEVWWWRYKALAAHAAAGRESSTEEVWEALDRARESMLARIATLDDAGFRRNYFNKKEINRQIIQEWIAQAAQRSLTFSPLTDHLQSAGDLQGSFGRLLDTGVRLSARHEPENLPRYIIDETVELTGADRTALMLYDAKGEQREVFAFGFHDAEAEQVEQSDFPGEMTAQVEESLRKRAALLRYRQAGEDGIVTYTDEPGEWRYGPEMVQRSVLCAPLIATSKLVGLLYCELDGIYGFFTRQDLDLLIVLANQAAMAIENADWAQTLEQRVEARTAELVTVNTISQAAASELEQAALIELIGEQVRQVFAADIAYVALHDLQTGMIYFPYGYGDSYDPLPFGEGLTSRIIETSEALLINEGVDDHHSKLHITPVGKMPRSYLGVPIISYGQAIGVISVQSSTQEGRFSQADAELLSTIAANVGTAIQNARLFEEVEASRRAADGANQAKSAFLANMSHELRTPLNAVIGYSEMLAEEAEELGYDDFIPDLEKIRTAGRHLLEMINQVLDLAKIEAGKVDLALDNFDVAAMVANLETTIQPLVARNENTLEIVCDSHIGVMHGDETRLRQVLLNLLSNAAKFTKAGCIRLVVNRHKQNGGDWLRLQVMDSGIGMTEAQLARIFEPFEQAESTTGNKYGGTGLGLTISLQLCRMMGGGLTAESVPGEGSTFTVDLPWRVEL